MPTFSQFFPSSITLNADDPAKLETIAAWMTQASPRLAALPGFVDAIQPTWTAQILSNPLGTIRDTAVAFGSAGHLAVDAARLAQVAQRTRGTAAIHADLLNRAAGGPGRQTFAAILGVTSADVQWLADEAALLETGSAISDRYGAAAQAVVDNWTPPAGDPDTIRYTLLETRTALYPTSNAVKDMAATLRGVHDRLVATLRANAVLTAQIQAASEGGSAPPVLAPPLVKPAPAPAANNNVWWLLGGMAVAGVGVYAITRASKNPLHSASEGGGWYVKVFSTLQGTGGFRNRYLKKIEGPFRTQDEADMYADRKKHMETQVLYQSPYTRRVFGG